MSTASPKARQPLNKLRTPSPQPAEYPSSPWLFGAVALAAVLVFFGAYSNSFQNGFHFDDMHVIVDNLFIRDLSNVPRFFTDARTSSALPANAVYRPLVSLTLATDYALAGGLNPVWFHITQLTLFLAIGVMLFKLYCSVFASTGLNGWRKWAALFGATLFCVHTANAETANYISSRSELLSGCGVLAAFLIYIHAPGLRKFCLYLLPVAAAVLAKTPAVMFAPLLLVYMLFIEEQLSLREAFSGKEWPKVRKVLLRVAPAFVIAAGLYFFAEGMNPSSVNYGGAGRMQYLSTQTWVWVGYVREFFIPSGLSADTDLKPFTTWADPRVFAGILLLAGSIVIGWRTSRTRETRPVAFGIAWFWIALFPSSSIFALAEVTNGHRAFFPYMGLTAAVVWWATVSLRSLATSGSRRRLGMAAAAAAVLVTCAYATATYMRNRVWLNEETLWADVAKKSPGNGRGLMNYGLTQMRLGRYPIAKDYFTRASVLNPNYPLIYVNLAIVNNAMGDSASAEPLFKRALAIEPNYVGGRFFYARWLTSHGRAAEAIPLLQQAISLSPGELPSRRALLDLYAASGDTARLSALIAETVALAANDSVAREYSNVVNASPAGTSAEWFKRGLPRTGASNHAAAAAAYRVAIQLDSTNADAWNNLGWSLTQLGFDSQARAAFERSIRIRPDNVAAKSNLVYLNSKGGSGRFTEAFQLQTSGRSAEAIPIYNELLANNPGWVNAHYNLGHALMTIGKCPEAVKEFERTLALQPNYPLAHLHLSTCFGKLGKRADSAQHRAIYDRSLTGAPPASR